MNHRPFVITALVLFSFSSAARAENVLVIGDSHAAGEFGNGLVEVLDWQSDIHVTVSASCGSSPANWLDSSDPKYSYFSNRICVATKTPSEKKIKYTGTSKNARPMRSLSQLKRASQPGTVVIALGTNQLPQGNSTSFDSRVQVQIEHLVDEAKAGGAKCVWIGPPKEPTKGSPYQRKGPGYSLKGQLDFLKMLKSTVEAKGCTFVNSRTYTNEKDCQNDPHGTHYYPYSTSKGGQNPGEHWGAAVAGEVITAIRIKGPTSNHSGISNDLKSVSGN